MVPTLLSVLDCIRHQHDRQLMLLAGIVCAAGIYASFAIGRHALRAMGNLRPRWGFVSIVASGCTAWATHFIVLLAFKPGMPAAFDPVLTAASLACAVLGIGAGVGVSMGIRRRWSDFAAGLIVGVGVAALHYVGQAAYLVPGKVSWNLWLVLLSIIVSLPISGAALAAAAHRHRRIRSAAAPALLLSIAILHFCGMAAMTLRFDPGARLPASAVSPQTITPIVAGVSVALIVLAVFGWRFDLSAKARLRQDRQRLRELASFALEGLLICDGDVIVTANDSAERIAGREPGALTGTFASALLPGLDLPSLPQLEEREGELERFLTLLNRRGFPQRCFSDSRSLLVVEASTDGTSIVSGSSEQGSGGDCGWPVAQAGGGSVRCERGKRDPLAATGDAARDAEASAAGWRSAFG